jgi:alkaline phosphatase D
MNAGRLDRRNFLYRQGGYIHPAAWANLVQRVQTGHNPDPYDPAPVAQGIGVCHGAFRYGGVGFAMVEDRKSRPGTTATPRGSAMT